MTHSNKTQGHGEQSRTMKAKKSLGQNFLKSAPALKKIVEAGDIQTGDIILEIGPGRGALTKLLLAEEGQVLAIEKDRDLYEFLKIKFEKEILSGKLNLINADILEFDPKTYSLYTRPYKIIANIPYNITGAILKKFLTAENQPELMVLMVQQEVAQRIMARDKKESLLSISVKAYGLPEMILKVPARYFSPAPKVDSAVIKISNISRDFFTKNKLNEEKFWEVLRAGFVHKRKQVKGNLQLFKENLNRDSFEALHNSRAEDLTLQDWLSLIK